VAAGCVDRLVEVYRSNGEVPGPRGLTTRVHTSGSNGPLNRPVTTKQGAKKKKNPPSSSSNFSICITSQGSQADWARWPMDEQMNNRNMSFCRQKRN
jgi:hypothetical protein